MRDLANLSPVRSEAITALLIFGATKPGLGLLTGYVTAMLVAGVYSQVMVAPAGGHSAPDTLGWSTYAAAMLPVWGLLIMPMLLLCVYGVYKPLDVAAQEKEAREKKAAAAAGKRSRWAMLAERINSRRDSTDDEEEDENAAAKALARLADAGIDPLFSTICDLRAAQTRLLAQPAATETPGGAGPSRQLSQRASAAAGSAARSLMGIPSGLRTLTLEHGLSTIHTGVHLLSQSASSVKDGLVDMKDGLEQMPKLSSEGRRAMVYLLGAIFCWGLLGGTIEGVSKRGFPTRAGRQPQQAQSPHPAGCARRAASRSSQT